MTNDDKILTILETLQEGQREQGAAIARLEQGQKQLEQGQKEQGSVIARFEQGLAQTNTIVGKIKTVVETTEETVNNMDAGLTEVVKDHRERIKRLEEQARITSHKN
jgi:hypothetical protein